MSTAIITGTQIAYYNICHRKLWLFCKNISLEHTSELVDIGKIIHEHSYRRKRKEISLEGIKVDLLDTKQGIIHEVKKSKALEHGHRWQIKYYIYYLKNLGLEVEGIIDYPKLKHREIITLEESDVSKIENMLAEINKMLDQTSPPLVINKPYCKKCSYYDFCYC